MLQALTFLTMRGARTGIECWCCDARVITPCRLRVRPRRNFWPPGTHHLTIRCSRTSQIRNASQASCSIAAPPSSAGTSSTLRGSGCRRRQSLLLRPAVTTQVDANPSQADHNTTQHIQAAAALLQIIDHHHRLQRRPRSPTPLLLHWGFLSLWRRRKTRFTRLTEQQSGTPPMNAVPENVSRCPGPS